jgi:putative peptidoglycan lipid II flippase
LTLKLVKIFFPGAGLLVLSAWCLGVLNSHRRFFLSYTAPVIWNVSIIAALVGFGGLQVNDKVTTDEFWGRLAVMAAWGSVIGSGLQFGVQLPTVLQLVKRLRLTLDTTSTHVRTVVRNFFPVFMSRGVVQISAFIDTLIASYLPIGAVSALTFAQSIYTLPVSLFGMSVSAAELPAMSSTIGDEDEVAEQLRRRLNAGLRQIAFFIVPSAMAFLALGDIIVGVLYRTGKFTDRDVLYVWGILAGSSIGLLASTLGRLYSSTYYALHDTRTPLRYAVLRIISSIALGVLLAIFLPPALGIDLRWGVIGLTAASGVAGWIEFFLLRRTLNRRIGQTGLPFSYISKLWLAAFLSAFSQSPSNSPSACDIRFCLPPYVSRLTACSILPSLLCSNCPKPTRSSGGLHEFCVVCADNTPFCTDIFMCGVFSHKACDSRSLFIARSATLC